MYLSSTVSKSGYLTKKLPDWRHLSVMSRTVLESCPAFCLLTTGAKLEVMKWRRGKGTKFVWNSFISTFNSPSNRRAAVMEDTTFAMILFKLSYDGFLMSNFFWQISYRASLSRTRDTSVWSNNQCVDRRPLYGSTMHVEMLGDG